MNERLEMRILRLFGGSDREAWDLHAFFDLAGDAEDRRTVLDTVDAMVAEGYLESRGSDFYTLTEKGKEAAERGSITQ